MPSPERPCPCHGSEGEGERLSSSAPLRQRPGRQEEPRNQEAGGAHPLRPLSQSRPELWPPAAPAIPARRSLSCCPLSSFMSLPCPKATLKPTKIPARSNAI